MTRPSKPATAARIYDYLLGGTHNFPADREAAKGILAMFPQTRVAAQINRAFMRRAVRHLCDAGVTQFLDIGSGIPTEGNVHEIAQAANPEARVVYVDIDPVAVSESQELLENNQFAVAIQGDARAPESFMEHPLVRKVIDLEQPVAVLLVALLHFIHDDDEARCLLRRVLESMAPGSHLVISHGVDELVPDLDSEDVRRLHEIYKRQTATTLRLRTRAEIEGFFEGLEIVEPGIVWLPEWRPAPDDPPLAVDDPIRYGSVGGIGKKS
jgi:SAM-dependent methyltransferase